MLTLSVSDLKRSVAFYRDGLGFPTVNSPDGVAFFDLNGSWLSLFGRDALALDATVSPVGDGFKGFTLSHNVRTETAVNEVLIEAVSAGGKLVKPAQKVEWGGYSGCFADPDGFLWEVAHNPFLWIGPEDQDTCPAACGRKQPLGW